jgi:predicted DsbA family dithiol-disulfide isomerase
MLAMLLQDLNPAHIYCNHSVRLFFKTINIASFSTTIKVFYLMGDGMEKKPVIEIYASIECPFAYLTVYRLRQVWGEFDDRLSLAWRALSLEWINHQSYALPLFEAERELIQQIEPELPWQPWSRPQWEFPSTFWPAFEALACAQAQGQAQAFVMSWELRRAFFAGSRNISLRNEIMAVAESAAHQTDLNLDRFQADWDNGKYKALAHIESQRGWKELKLDGSATFVLPDGSRHTNPASDEPDIDEENYRVRGYEPYVGDPLDAYRAIFSHQ